MVATLGACSGAEAEEPQALVSEPRVVTAARAQVAPLTRLHRFSGVVRAANRAELTFTISGRVAVRPANIGDTVRAGATLAVLDRRPLRNALAAARASRKTIAARLAQAERDADRAERLKRANAIGAEELEKTVAGLDTLRAQAAAAEANVAEAQRMLGEATLRAPFAGTVLDVRLEPGEFAQAGRPAVLLSGERSAEVEVEIPERLRRFVAVGANAQVHFPLSDAAETTAIVSRVGRAAAGTGALVPVVVDLPVDLDVAAGQTAEVRLESIHPAALTVPIAAIVDPSGARPSIFRIVDQAAMLTPIELGAVTGDRIVVTTGVTSGELVVVAGHANLVSGEAIRVGGSQP